MYGVLSFLYCGTGPKNVMIDSAQPDASKQSS